MNEIKTRLLIAEVQRWVGVAEQGNNSGQLIEMFQKSVDGVAQHESYCMAFVQYCLQQVDAQCEALAGLCSNDKHMLFRSEHCLTVWAKSPKECRIDKPVIGSVVIWQHGNTANGHTGIVTGIKDDEFFTTIEANTGPSAGVERNGDGVYEKTRSVKGSGEMKVLGFLLPWGPVS